MMIDPARPLCVAAALAIQAHAAMAQEPIGIPDCDTFITRYEGCLAAHVPAEQQAVLKQQIAIWRTEWIKMAKDPSTRPVLQSICKTTMEQVKTTVKPLGCEF
jgi:hypothetical protein